MQPSISGASDHGISEAIYLPDPDGNGIELAADRPPERWGDLRDPTTIGPNPLDLPDLAREHPHVGLVPILSDARGVQLLVRKWEKKGRLPDAIVIEHPRRAGGHLGMIAAVDQHPRRHQKPHPPVGYQDLGKTRDVDGALQRIERRQPRQMGRGEVRIGVVFDDVQVMRLCELEQSVRSPERERSPGRVVQHRNRDVQPWSFMRFLRFDQALHHRQVGPVVAARHGQHAQAQGGQAGVLHRPAGLVDQHRIAGAQQGAGHDVQRLGRTQRGHDLLGRGLHAQVHQTQ